MNACRASINSAFQVSVKFWDKFAFKCLECQTNTEMKRNMLLLFTVIYLRIKYAKYLTLKTVFKR